MRITLEQLKSKDACKAQVKLFAELFGDGVEVTRANCLLAAKHKMNFDWAVDNLLSYEQRKTYEDAEAPLWQTYLDAKAALWQTYEDAEAPLWQTYRDTVAALWQTYGDAESALRQTYLEGVALAFYQAVTGDES